MKELSNIKQDIAQMSKVSLRMYELMHRAFMEHDAGSISLALKEEDKLNNFEKTITADLVDFTRGYMKKEKRLEATIYVDVVADLELIGDYCKDILERIQIKIEEKLLFSEEAVKEYNELYQVTQKAIEEITKALDKDSPGLVKKVLKNERHIDRLVDEYRRRHDQRLLAGVCSPMACNMFLNMLDFTAAIYYHAKKICRALEKIRT